MKRIPAARVLWLLAGFLVAAGHADAGDITPGLRHGLLFQPRGPLTLATGAWTAVIRFRQQDVERQVDTIRRQFGQIDNALQEVRWSGENTTQTPETRRRRQFLGEMNKMWQRERFWMDAELRSAESGIRELQAELKLSRRTRGLINALGEGLKWLFGTATEKDTQELHKQIKGVEVGLGKLHHITELQTTLIGSITKEQRVNTRNIALVAKKTAELELTLAGNREADHLTMRNIRRELDLSQVVTSAIRTAGAAVMAFNHEIKQIARSMEHTQQGRVTPVILSPTKLKRTLAAITEHLPEGWVPAVPLSDSPAHIYKFLDLSAVALEDGWEVHIKIPLQYRPYSQYQLYQVTAIPTHLPNSSLALQTKITAAYFAISRDQRLHLEARAEDITRCRRAGGRTMCHELTPLIKEKREGCLYHAFRDDREKTSKDCQKTVIKPTPQVYAITERKWLYVLPTEETFSMQCTGEPQPEKGFRLQGTGVFSLPSGCAAMGDKYIVPAHLRRRTNRPGEVDMDDLTHFKVSVDLADVEARVPSAKQLNQTELNDIMSRATEKSSTAPTLAELQELIGEWKEPEPEENFLPASFVNHTSMSLGIIGVLGVVGLMIFTCYKIKRFPGPSVPCKAATNPPYLIPPTAPEAPESPIPDIIRMQTRIAHLEATTYELQKKVDSLASQGAALEALQRKYEDLTCLL